MPEKTQIFLMSVPGFILSDDIAICDIQSSKERHGVVPLIVMGDAFRISQAHREHGLSSLHGLNLILLIDAEHYGILRVGLSKGRQYRGLFQRRMGLSSIILSNHFSYSSNSNPQHT